MSENVLQFPDRPKEEPDFGEIAHAVAVLAKLVEQTGGPQQFVLRDVRITIERVSMTRALQERES